MFYFLGKHRSKGILKNLSYEQIGLYAKVSTLIQEPSLILRYLPYVFILKM